MNKRYIYESLTDYQKNDMLTKWNRIGTLFISGFEYQGLSIRTVDISYPSSNTYRLYRLVITMICLWFKCIRDAKNYDEFIKLYDDRLSYLIKEADSIAEKIRESTEYKKDHPISSFIEYLKKKGEAPPICAMERYKPPTESESINKEG